MNNQKVKYRWTYNDECACCAKYLSYTLKDITQKNVAEVIKVLKKILPQISEVSLRMKMANIKYLCKKYDIPDFVMISPLEHASIKNEQIFCLALEIPEIQTLIKERRAELDKLKELKSSKSKNLDDIRREACSFRKM